MYYLEEIIKEQMAIREQTKSMIHTSSLPQPTQKKLEKLFSTLARSGKWTMKQLNRGFEYIISVLKENSDEVGAVILMFFLLLALKFILTIYVWGFIAGFIIAILAIGMVLAEGTRFIAKRLAPIIGGMLS